MLTDGEVYCYARMAPLIKGVPEVVGYVVLNGQFLGVRFEGSTVDEVRGKALEFYEEKRQLREQAIQSRTDARAKAQASKAKKAGAK